MIGSCLSRYNYSFKSENNCCSVYMNKTFYGHTHNVNGLLNLDHSDTHNIDAKICKVDNNTLLQDAANATLRSETLRRNCVR